MKRFCNALMALTFFTVATIVPATACLIQWSVSGYPSGVQRLGHVTFTDSQYQDGNFGTVTDDRSW